MLLTILGLGFGLLLLFLGGEWLVKGAARLAKSLGISPLIVGLTVVSIGTSAPELLISLNAALSGSPDLVIGNVVGSNIANVGLILGVSGLIYPIRVRVELLRRQIPIMIGVMLLAVLLFRDGLVGRDDGVIFIIGLVIFSVFMIISARAEQQKTYDIPEEKVKPDIETIQRGREAARLVIGIILLIIGAQFTISNATELARALGISELVIGITLVAVGTSLPELVTSITAALRQQSDITIGNVVGSNIFNVLAVLGITSLVKPINVPQQVIQVDSWVMLAFSLGVLPFVLDRKFSRREGVIFLSAYLIFSVYAFTGNA